MRDVAERQGASDVSAFPLGLVVNTAARGVKRRFVVRDPFWENHVPDPFVRLTQNLDDLDDAIATFRAAKVRAIAVMGGDGSLHHTVDTVLRHYQPDDVPMVLALAGGTMNGLARAMGTGGRPENVLRAAVAALREADPSFHLRYVLRVTDTREQRTRYGFGFATGLVYRVFQQYYRSPEPGIIDAVRASILPLKAALFGGELFKGIMLDVRSGGAAWMPEAPHTLVANTVDDPLLWFKPFGAPLADAAAFHLAATSMRPLEIAPRLWSIFRGRCRHPRLRIDRTDEAAVIGNTGYLIDGDLYPGDGATDVRLTLGPRLRFLVPAQTPPD